MKLSGDSKKWTGGRSSNILQMERSRFVIEASEAESKAEKAGLTVMQLLPSLVNSAQKLARPPISKYHVGAVGLGSSGRIFLGEIRDAPDIKVLITSSSDQEFRPLSEFLPNRFGPDDLLDKDTPLLLEPQNNGLSLVNAIGSQLALEAANKSHAPYSGCPSGVALIDSEGRVYRGSYMESAAYNPSLGPVQAALVAYIAGGGDGYEEIVGAVLVEKEEAQVKQEQTARLLLNLISPKCEFRVFYCSLGIPAFPPVWFRTWSYSNECPEITSERKEMKTVRRTVAEPRGEITLYFFEQQREFIKCS
ncbi:unnamed protein product, partial [Vitis vinifera]